MYKSAEEVLRSYPFSVKMEYDSQCTEQGCIEVIVIANGQGWDIWNMHPMRKAWQHVYTLKECSPREQCKQSMASVKRLYE